MVGKGENIYKLWGEMAFVTLSNSSSKHKSVYAQPKLLSRQIYRQSLH